MKRASSYRPLNGPSTSDKLDDKYNKSQYQQDVDQIADSRSSKTKAKCPKYQ